MPTTRRQLVFFILGGFFLTNAIVAELTGGKLFHLPSLGLFGWPAGGFVLSIGVILWPVVFITTDLVNEYFGKAGVRMLTFLAVGMIFYSFLVLFAAIRVPAAPNSPVSGDSFRMVFGQSQWIIVGSLTAFLIAQFVDVIVFTHFRKLTRGRLLWLRATGSTIISQLFDTFLVGWIAFVLPKRMGWSTSGLTMSEFIPLAIGGYCFKLLVAIGITPVIYLGHAVIDRFLEGDETEPHATVTHAHG